jgi:hypothetical protein
MNRRGAPRESHVEPICFIPPLVAERGARHTSPYASRSKRLSR